VRSDDENSLPVGAARDLQLTRFTIRGEDLHADDALDNLVIVLRDNFIRATEDACEARIKQEWQPEDGMYFTPRHRRLWDLRDGTAVIKGGIVFKPLGPEHPYRCELQYSEDRKQASLVKFTWEE
jgi:hypothetical protein